MSVVNSHGHGHPNSKTIHVESNLLDIWIGERRVQEERLQRAGIAYCALVLTACCFLPALASLARSQSSLAAKKSQELKQLNLQVSHAEQLASAADPTLQRQAMEDKTTNKATAFLMAITAAMNSTPDAVCFGEIRGEMLAGDMTISGKAEAVNANAAQDFIRNLAKTSGISSALLAASRPDATLGPNGVAFEFIARAEGIQK